MAANLVSLTRWHPNELHGKPFLWTSALLRSLGSLHRGCLVTPPIGALHGAVPRPALVGEHVATLIVAFKIISIAVT